MSAFLLDTHAFIWLTENDSSLPEQLRIIIDTCLPLWESHSRLPAFQNS
jgi:PIN domain nuclease of toxin-antitoxin system